MSRLIFLFFIFIVKPVFSLSDTQGVATFTTIEGFKCIGFNPQKFTDKAAPLFASLINSQPKPFGKKDKINIDLTKMGYVNLDVMDNLLNFYARVPLVLNTENIHLLIEHAKRFNLVLVGEELVRVLPKIMNIIGDAENSVPFNRIAKSICNIAFDSNGVYEDERHWCVQLFLMFQSMLLENNDKNYLTFEKILRAKKADNKLLTKAEELIIFHITEKK